MNFRQIAQFPNSRDPSNRVLRRETPIGGSVVCEKLSDTSAICRDLVFDPFDPIFDLIDPWGIS